MKRITFILFLIFIFIKSFCNNKLQCDTICYAKRSGIKLNIELISPCNFNHKMPAIIFFYGGGWIKGNREQFRPHASYLAHKGIVAILADYRTKEQCNATPFNCVEDAKSVIRFVKNNADKFNIDTTKIVAAGGSAGGHLAASCAYISNYNHPKDDLSISPRPTALVLFNPVIDNGKNGFGSDTIKKNYKTFSPLHNIKKNNALPTLFMVGDNDKLVPLKTAQKFKDLTEENGATCILKVYKKQEHGFFNYKPNSNNKYYKITLKELESFLHKLGYLQK